MRAVSLLLLLSVVACGSDPGLHERAPDASTVDAGGDDAPAAEGDGPVLPEEKDRGAGKDAARPPDLARPDLKKLDLGKPDSAKPDLKKLDLGKPDAAKPDAKKPDLGKPDAPPPGGLSVPCQHGPGYALFRFHYGGASHSPAVDVWSATCSYSYAPSSACNILAVYPGFGSVSYTSDGYPVLTTSEYLRVRFSVAGLSFNKASLHIQARSYATSSSTKYRVWSPIHGAVVGGPVDNDWIYDWYSLNWSNHLKPGDPPSLTAIQIYADQGSGHLAVRAVEVCVQ